ncbi:unnamed protein product [Peronospora belbahrii]|uniref:Uncharacterized protein n=1 Tax=Peronospora belbahrii TaxID=622444 RepID=A0AAU9LCY0_9STRA|nr:unnamed protein product [Peronospora belbahrii]
MFIGTQSVAITNLHNVMNENVAASNGHNQGLPRPPLPPSLRSINRHLTYHDQDKVNIDWEHSLQQFAATVSDDLNDLHARFLHEKVVNFTAWKRLWKDMRMSAAFLVEFWESTPTTTHKTILQQALDGLVWCIEEHNGEFDKVTDVAALIGRVFAIYCAYSVQVGSPKHKIDADPRAWTALLTINVVMSGVGAKLFPIAAREVRAMMHRLVVQENAFLRCLQGFGPRVRVKNRTPRSGAVVMHDLLRVADSTEESVPIHQSKAEKIGSLNDRYNELISRARAGPSVSSVGGRLGLRQAKKAVESPPLLSASLLQESKDDGKGLARTLTIYMEYKANEEGRKSDRIVRATAVREKESQQMLDSVSDTSSNILDLSDHGSAMSGPPRVVAESVTSNRRGSYRRRNSDASEALLVELESDLCADISRDYLEPSRAQSYQKLARAPNEKPYSTLSEVSEADSNALAELECELEQSADVISSEIRENALLEEAWTRARRRYGRKAAVLRNDPRATISTVKFPRTISTRSTAKGVRTNSETSHLLFADSWAVSSSGDNDEVAAIQAELDAVPTLSRSQMTERSSHGIDNQRKLFASSSSSKALSVVSDSSELIAQLQAELDFSAELKTSEPASSDVDRAKPRRSSRLSFVASVADNKTVEDLERELNPDDDAIGTALPPFVPASATTIRKRGMTTSKRPAQRTCMTRSSAKKKRLNTATASIVTCDRQLPADQTSKAQGEQQLFVSGLTVHPESSRVSFVSSDTESDGIAELVAELEIPAAVQISTRADQSRNLSAKRLGTRSTVRYQSPASPIVETPHSISGCSKISPIFAAIPDVVGLRRSSRLSPYASETESDGLDELMTELESDPHVVSMKKAKKPRTRVTTVRKQPSRVQGAKPRQNQSKRLKLACAPRAARQPQSQKVTEKPFTRQSAAVSVNVPSSRRSTRSSSTAFGSESDGLAELEAELQAGHT